MDEVKKYLRENRQELDVESPPSKEVWQHIQQQVPARRKNVVQPMFRWVAAACILLLTGTAAYMLWNKPAPKDEVVRTTPIDTTVQNPEIRGRAEDSLAPAISPLPGEVIADGDVTSKKNLANSVPKQRKIGAKALVRICTRVRAFQDKRS